MIGFNSTLGALAGSSASLDNLLLLMDGVQGGQQFTDEYGNYSVTPRVAGHFYTDTTDKVEGNASGRGLAGSLSQGLITNKQAFNFGLNKFTISFFFKNVASTGVQEKGVFGGAGISMYLGGSQDVVIKYLNSQGSNSLIVTAEKFNDLDSWYQIDICRDSNKLYLFFNGELIDQVNDIGNIYTSNQVSSIGAVNLSTDDWESVMIDAFKVIHGVCEHVSSFQPDNDLDFSLVSLLMHCDGVIGAVTAIDSSINNNVINFNGDAVISEAPSGMFAQAIELSGLGHIQIPPGPAFDFGADDFCIELKFNIKIKPIDDYVFLFDMRSGDDNITILLDTRLPNNAGILAFIKINGTFYIPPITVNGADNLTVGVTYSIRFNKEGSVARLFIEGILDALVGSVPSIPTITGDVGIGGSGATKQFDGFVDEVRITKGSSRGSGNYTIFNEPFQNQ